MFNNKKIINVMALVIYLNIIGEVATNGNQGKSVRNWKSFCSLSTKHFAIINSRKNKINFAKIS